MDVDIFTNGSYLGNAAFYGYNYAMFVDRMELYAVDPSNSNDFADSVDANVPGSDLNIDQPSE